MDFINATESEWILRGGEEWEDRGEDGWSVLWRICGAGQERLEEESEKQPPIAIQQGVC